MTLLSDHNALADYLPSAQQTGPTLVVVFPSDQDDQTPISPRTVVLGLPLLRRVVLMAQQAGFAVKNQLSMLEPEQRTVLEDLIKQRETLQKRYDDYSARKLDLDMTRGKPCPEQLDLSNAMATILIEILKRNRGEHKAGPPRARIVHVAVGKVGKKYWRRRRSNRYTGYTLVLKLD